MRGKVGPFALEKNAWEHYRFEENVTSAIRYREEETEHEHFT